MERGIKGLNLTNILALSFIISAIIIMLVPFSQEVKGEPIMIEKTVNITIQKDELVYCFMGNPKNTNIVCDKLDMNKKKFRAIDDILEAFVNDRVELSYKILK